MGHDSTDDLVALSLKWEYSKKAFNMRSLNNSLGRDRELRLSSTAFAEATVRAERARWKS